MRKSCIFIVILFLSLASGVFGKSVLEGVFSKGQADRGKKVYDDQCARCHSENLLGGGEAPSLVDDFVDRWAGNSAGRLVNLIQKTMPSDGPGAINRQQATDIATYIFSQNGFPAGSQDMVTDPAAQDEIQIEKKK